MAGGGSRMFRVESWCGLPGQWGSFTRNWASGRVGGSWGLAGYARSSILWEGYGDKGGSAPPPTNRDERRQCDLFQPPVVSRSLAPSRSRPLSLCDALALLRLIDPVLAFFSFFFCPWGLRRFSSCTPFCELLDYSLLSPIVWIIRVQLLCYTAFSLFCPFLRAVLTVVSVACAPSPWCWERYRFDRLVVEVDVSLPSWRLWERFELSTSSALVQTVLFCGLSGWSRIWWDLRVVVWLGSGLLVLVRVCGFQLRRCDVCSWRFLDVLSRLAVLWCCGFQTVES